VQLGGLHKKGPYLDQYRKNQSNLVIVDSGDLLFEPNEDGEILESVMPAAKLKAELMADIYNKIGIDAVNVGELDLALGIDYLKNDLAKKRNFPLISANLVDSKNALIFKPYVIKKVNGKNVGIFGVIGDTSEMAEKIKQITNGAASVQDPIKAAESIVKELSGKVDYMIALTHQGTNRDWVIARRVKGIDLVVGGHDKQKTKEPNAAEKTLIVQAGEKGQYLGMLEVSMDGTKTAKNELVPLAEEMPSDASIKAMITAYNEKIIDIYKNPEAKTEPKAMALKLTKCDPCHGDMVKKWNATAHAKAYETLVKKSKQFDPTCLACHTTRFEQPDGFNMKEQQPALVNVQCESCHGSAKEHLSDMKPIPTKKPAVALCIKCHTASRCPNFEKEAKQKFDLIKH
jgi:2',3'-cyclic-nucleotide 2'-phosphodiesterase (5'-nucleotidase family)